VHPTLDRTGMVIDLHLEFSDEVVSIDRWLRSGPGTTRSSYAGFRSRARSSGPVRPVFRHLTERGQAPDCDRAPVNCIDTCYLLDEDTSLALAHPAWGQRGSVLIASKRVLTTELSISGTKLDWRAESAGVSIQQQFGQVFSYVLSRSWSARMEPKFGLSGVSATFVLRMGVLYSIDSFARCLDPTRRDRKRTAFAAPPWRRPLACIYIERGN
jgi:hypothetical protein